VLTNTTPASLREEMLQDLCVSATRPAYLIMVESLILFAMSLPSSARDTEEKDCR
jgi:hypothetical protein